MGEIEDVLTVATLVIDHHGDAEGYVARRISEAEAAGDERLRRKWRRVEQAVRAMLAERRAHADRSGGG